MAKYIVHADEPASATSARWRKPVSACLATALAIGALSVIGASTHSEHTTDGTFNGQEALVEEMREFVEPDHQDLGDTHAAAVVVDPTDAHYAALNSSVTTKGEIASLSKVITVDIYEQLVADGTVRRTDQISTYLPLEGEAGEITLQQLADHTSGLSEWGLVDGMDEQSLKSLRHNPVEDATVGQLVEYAQNDPLATAGRYHYSNIGIALLGNALVTATKVDYDDLVAWKVFEPNFMHRSYVQDAQTDNPPIGRDIAGHLSDPVELGAYAPTGGIVSTPQDMGNYVSGLLLKIPAFPLIPPGEETFKGMIAEPETGRLVKSGNSIGYSTALVLEPNSQRGAVVIADADVDAVELAHRLLDTPAGNA